MAWVKLLVPPHHHHPERMASPKQGERGGFPSEALPVRLAAPIASQYQLFPRKILSEAKPASVTADCVAVAEADDGLCYVLKRDQKGKATCASEWLCSLLSEIVGIAAPPVACLERLDGSIVFGSRHLTGASDQITTQNYLLRSTLGSGEASNLARILSSIYAFDLFVDNGDRHLKNYLTVPDGGVRRLFAFDYSRALFWDWPWRGVPAVGSNTRNAGKILRLRHGFDAQAADEMLVRLQHVSVERMQAIIASLPSEWLPSPLRQSFLRAWAGNERSERISMIRKGVADGWLL